MRVLLGVDGSASSDLAALLVANLAWPAGATIRVVTAYPGAAALYYPGEIATSPDVVQQAEDAMEAEARRLAIHVARRFAAPDVTVETRVVRERAGTAILQEADAFDAELVVLGNRGRGAFESAVLGSVSAEVVDHGHRPVLIARRDHVSRILLGEDGSDSAAAATEVLRRWSILHGHPVHVLSVADTDSQWSPWLLGETLRDAHDAATSSLHDHHEALAAGTAASLVEAGIQAVGGVADGSPALRLIEAGVQWGADLLVVGTHGRSGLGQLLLGSVARGVLYNAPCSVLIVPQAGETDAIPPGATRDHDA
jgi:nucleotide-binding universal stress UspA family protein